MLFVSHNLKMVAEFCHRCLLLEKGRTVMIGHTEDVIGTYLQTPSSGQAVDTNSGPVNISSVKVRDEDGECMQFRSGEKAWIDVELTAHSAAKSYQLLVYLG